MLSARCTSTKFQMIPFLNLPLKMPSPIWQSCKKLHLLPECTMPGFLKVWCDYIQDALIWLNRHNNIVILEPRLSEFPKERNLWSVCHCSFSPLFSPIIIHLWTPSEHRLTVLALAFIFECEGPFVCWVLDLPLATGTWAAGGALLPLITYIREHPVTGYQHYLHSSAPGSWFWSIVNSVVK